ncbi:MAG: DUF3011 domain-containing protein [Desulfobulbus sp.]
MKKFFFLSTLSGLALIVIASVADGRTITCESYDGRSQFCQSDTRGGVRLIRKLSKSACHEGQSWGYDGRGIWVSRGCRAQFEVADHHREQNHYDNYDRRPPQDDRGYRPPPPDYERRNRPDRITCESWDNRRTYCPAHLRHAQVEIMKQFSKQSCRYGENWGWDGGGIWVRGGCRAVFSIY